MNRLMNTSLGRRKFKSKLKVINPRQCVRYKHGPKRKSSAKKRFRLTGSGNLKYFPRQSPAKRSKVIKKHGVKGNFAHFAELLPNSSSVDHGWRNKRPRKEENELEL